MTPAGTPSSRKKKAAASQLLRELATTSTGVLGVAAMSEASIDCFVCSSAKQTCCETRPRRHAGRHSRLSSMRTKSCRATDERSALSDGVRLAQLTTVLRSCGAHIPSSRTTRSTAGSKPISSISSASASARRLTREKSRQPFSRRSSILDGVASSSVAPVIVFIVSSIGTPPHATAMRIGELCRSAFASVAMRESARRVGASSSEVGAQTLAFADALEKEWPPLPLFPAPIVSAERSGLMSGRSRQAGWPASTAATTTESRPARLTGIAERCRGVGSHSPA
mmetsp:Transcript_8813/g.19074  ORF Transcript_8813/g.19074 Transcript_8813/m.19074 type:complete len:282 (-) Transcript_8813:170-1015(-)